MTDSMPAKEHDLFDYHAERRRGRQRRAYRK